jgi:glycosyltransferase involved in cell wall biosynthesis
VLDGKRIVVVLCDLEMGGAERQAIHVAKHLMHDRGAKVQVWSLGGEGLAARRCEDLGVPWRAPMRFHWPCRKSTLLRRLPRLAMLLRREHPDILLPYTTGPNIGCGLVWRLTGARACIWNHRSATGGLTGRPLERLAIRLASAVIANSSHAAAFLHRVLGAREDRVHVIHNGVEMDAAETDRCGWRERLQVSPDAFVASMVANFRPEKDHVTLLHAWRLVVRALESKGQKAILVLAGRPWLTHDQVRALAVELGLMAHVRFPGQVRDIAGLLGASDLGILASHTEGLPNSLLEYMACGLPVVATDIPGTREVLGADGARDLVMPHDSEAMGERILAYAGNPSLRRKVGERNCQRVAVHFSLNTTIMQTTALTERLLQPTTRNEHATTS